MGLGLGIGIGLGLNPSEGVGVSWTVGTPTIAVVTPVANPPAFDIDFNDTVMVGDVIKLRIDGATTYSSAALNSGDLLAGTVTITNGTLTAGDHTADASVWRGGVQVSAWSSVSNYTITALARFDSNSIKFDSTTHKFDEAA